MQAKEIVKKTEKLVRPAAERMGLTIWDVTYEKEGGEYMLTVTLDRESGVSIDDCEALSREIDPLLDRENYITDAYTFCVSSAGLERRLTKPWHYDALMGEKVELKFYRAIDGQKSVAGVLEGYSPDGVTLDGRLYPHADIAAAKRYFEF